MLRFNRRRFLGSLAAGALLTAAAPTFASPGSATKLRIQYREIAVKGRRKQVFGLQQPNGQHGLVLGPGERFRVELVNAVRDPLLIHWHGQEPPASQDGVPELSQHPLPPGTTQLYDFAPRPGTHWMHSHLGFQEQDLMAAPLIVRTAEDERADQQEVVVMLHDFTFGTPEAILAGLGGLTESDPHAGHHAAAAAPAPAMAAPMTGMDHSAHMMPGMAPPTPPPAEPVANPHAGHDMSGAMDLNDVNFDAYLANDRTLDDPEIVRVESGGRVRLRLINASAQTNFFIDLGALDGRAIAVDGNPIQPVPGRRFPLAIAQRLDLVVDLPPGQGAWPILAQREGEKERTGIVLATARGPVAKLDMAADPAGPLAADEFETRLAALIPLAARAPDRRVTVKLTGTMSPYAWSLSGHASGENLPIDVAYGERVEFTLRNDSPMAHPVHLHGHHFQVTGLEREGRPIAFRGAVRDTVLVGPRETATVEFDALNPGRWAFHCHMLYHQLTGMMGEVRYRA
jgi:FtsP/CotA-like multicopper oxidase with cupredoxin domain